jgi:transcriptional regulator NrdR family protein
LLFLESFRGVAVDQNWEKTISSLPAIAIVDSKSVYDAVHKLANTASQVEDKRTAIDLAIIKRDLDCSKLQIRWVTTEAQMADTFTKKMPADSLRRLLETSRLSIVSEERALQGKAESRLDRGKLNFGKERVFPV